VTAVNLKDRNIIVMAREVKMGPACWTCGKRGCFSCKQGGSRLGRVKSYKSGGPLTIARTPMTKQVQKVEKVDLLGMLGGFKEKFGVVAADREIPPHLKKKEAKEEKKKEGWEILRDEKNFKDALVLLKGVVFKADKPYRCRLAYGASFTTSVVGVVNVSIATTAINTVGEWSSIDALFDQFYVHSITAKFHPRNIQGGAMGSSASAAAVGPLNPGADTVVSNAALVCVSLFGNANAYSGGGAMLTNPSHKVNHTSKKFSYVWRNNVRFDPHGISLGSAVSGAGWQGWMDITAVSNYGGFMQFRILDDLVIGSGSAAVILGDFAVYFDVSFRSRA